MANYSVLDVIMKHKMTWEGSGRDKGVPLLKKHLNHHFLGQDINAVTHDDFQAQMDRYLDGRPESQNGNRIKEEFNSLMSFAVRHKFRTTPYLALGRAIRVSQARSVLSSKELECILLETDKTFRSDLKVRIAIRALALLGLNPAEASAFALAKVDPQTWKYIHADGIGRLRQIPIPGPMRPLLRHAMEHFDKNLTGESVWINIFRLNRIVKEIGLQCELPELKSSMLTRTRLKGTRKE